LFERSQSIVVAKIFGFERFVRNVFASSHPVTSIIAKTYQFYADVNPRDAFPLTELDCRGILIGR